MRGYGRGYYGDEQLAQPRRAPSRARTWIPIAVAVGLGAAVVWFLLPSGSKASPEPEPTAVLPPQPAPQAAAPQTAAPTALTHEESLEQLARARGFPSMQAYEDSMVASARELRAAGWKVEMPTHLQHLEARLVG